MKCPNCQAENPSGAKFCSECGSRIVLSVAEPASPIPPQEYINNTRKYSPRGLSEKIVSQTKRMDGELRQVTIMFCDMKGFTPLSAKIGPERTFSLMDRIFEIIIRRVNEYEGMVNELRGDGALAFFGAPIATEEAPVKALHCALAIQMDIATFNETISAQMDISPILFRIGINSGPVFVGFVGNDLGTQLTAQGDTVNVAARMETIAKPGTICVTEETYKATKAMFRFQDLGDVKIKGKERPVRVYQLLSPKGDTHRPRLGTERFLYSEMIGRDEELARLELQMMKAVNGEGSIVNIVGEAGIGKSRLIAELKKRDVMKWTTFLEGRATSIGRNLSFHPMIDLLRRWAGIMQQDSSTTAAYKLEKAVQGIWREDLHEVLPFLATLMGTKLSDSYAERIRGIEGDALEKMILKSIRDFLTRASEMTCLVIVFEDLHWSDTSSIELLEGLFRLAKTKRILFINLFRPGYEETGDRIAQTVERLFPECFLTIVLEPLNGKLSESLITNMLKTGPHHPFIRTVIERAGGNPFFIEEIVQSFIDQNLIVFKGGAVHLSEEIETISIPSTINDLLMARIDRLEEKTRDLLKTASVIGRNFFYRILRDVAGNIPDIDDRLVYLEKMQLIKAHRRMGEVEYIFKHALSHEAAYQSILENKRKQLHLRVADSIRSAFDERLQEYNGMLAYHYSKGENLDEAETYLIKAGEAALKSSASSEALNYYRQALELYLKKSGKRTDPEKIAMFDRNIALALYDRGRYEEAIEHFDKVLGYVWNYPKKHSRVDFFRDFLQLIISIYFPVFRFKKPLSKQDIEACELFNKKTKALAIINPREFFFESLHFLNRITKFDLTRFESGYGLFVGASTLFSFTGISFKLSKKILRFVKNRIDETDIRQFTVYAFSCLIHNYLKGDWAAIEERDGDKLIDKNLDIGDIWLVSLLSHWHCWPCIYKGNFHMAQSFVSRLDELYGLYENHVSLTLKYLVSPCLLMETRRLEEALQEIEKGIEFAKGIGMGASMIHLFSCQARIWLLLGNMDEAQQCLGQADTIRREVSTVPWMLSHFMRSRVELDLNRLEVSMADKGGNTSELEAISLKSAKALLLHSTKVAQHRTESFRLMGRYFFLTSSWSRAHRWWQAAIDEGNRLGARLELARTYSEVGYRLLNAPRRPHVFENMGAEEYLEKAKTMFEEMNLQWDLVEWHKGTGC
jgi:class 3 adenylate cyclase/tetratricopeptide (TPR) repeat protein